MRAGILALLTGAAGAVSALGGFRPLITRWPASAVASLPGFVASELPRCAAAAQLLGAAGAVRGGALRGVSGWAGLGLSAASLVGYAGLEARVRASDEVLRRALADAGLVAAPGGGDGEVLAATARRRLVPGARRRYAAVRDVAYGEHGRRNLLDVWRHPDLPTNATAPVLLQVHGGAWSGGRKEGQAHPLMAYLVDRGWVCVTMNYRLGPAASWPDMIVDVKRAIGWVRSHAPRFGGDPGFLAVTGGSAGAHLCALAALTAGDPAFQPGFEDVDTSVAAAVPFYGVYDLTRDDGSGSLAHLVESTVIKTSLASDHGTWEQASPAYRVHPDAPPFLVLHGTSDAIVTVEQARRFVAALRRSSRAPVAYAELPAAQHGFDALPTARTRSVVRAVAAFLREVRARRETDLRGRPARR